MVAYQIAFFPFVFRAVRDLKFKEKIRAKANLSTNNLGSNGCNPIKKVLAIFKTQKSSNLNREPDSPVGVLYSREAETQASENSPRELAGKEAMSYKDAIINIQTRANDI